MGPPKSRWGRYLEGQKDINGGHEMVLQDQLQNSEHERANESSILAIFSHTAYVERQ